MSLARNIVSTLAANVVGLALALVSSVVLARALGPEGRGIFALVLLMPELATSLGMLGFEHANSVYAGIDPVKRRALVWQSAALAAIVGALAALAGGVLLFRAGSGWLRPGIPLWVYVLPLLVIPTKLAVSYWRAILRGANRILVLNVIDVGGKAVAIAFIAAAVAWLRLGVGGAVAADSLVALVVVLVMIGSLRSIGAWGKPTFDAALWSRAWRFALPAYFGTVASYLNYRADQFIVALLLPPEQLAFYALAVGIAEPLWIVTGAIGTALLPHLTNSGRKDPALAVTIARHVLIWTALGCGLVFVLADVAIRFAYSSAFSEAATPLRWLLPGILTLSVAKVLVAELLAREKVTYQAWVGIGAAVLNILANFVLVPRMGIAGAALASTLSYSFLSILVTNHCLQVVQQPWSALLPRRTDLDPYLALWARITPTQARVPEPRRAVTTPPAGVVR